MASVLGTALDTQDPFDDLAVMGRRLRHALDRSFAPRAEREVEEPEVIDVEVGEDTLAYLIVVTLPRVNKDQVRVRVQGALITVEGMRACSSGTSLTRFAREFAMPHDADILRTEARHEGETLRMRVPRSTAVTLGVSSISIEIS